MTRNLVGKYKTQQRISDWFYKESRKHHRCECGCNSIIVVKRTHFSSGIPKFIRGHHSRVDNQFKGKKHSDEFKESRMGEGNPNWNGEKYKDTKGYIRVLDVNHKYADTKGYVKEHIKVWYENNGDIPKDYCIHHINGDKGDNKIENLKLMTKSEHSSYHFKGNKFGQIYSESTVLIWVNLHNDGLTYEKISKLVNVDKTTIFKRVKKFREKYPKPDWAETQIFRASGLLENICKEHQCGHPHENWLKIYDPDGKKGFAIHCCCSCCSKE